MDNVQRQNELRQDEIRVEVVQQQQQQQEQQSMQFDQLETYHQAEGESIEQARTSYMQQALSKQAEVNARLQQNFQRNVQQNRVTQTAPVTQPPVQEQRARESQKQRRERQNKVRKARKVCPVGNEYTLEISKAITEYDDSMQNSLKVLGVTEERARAVNADRRMLKVFCNGFRLKKNGQVEEDDWVQAHEDAAFITDYLSGDRQRRKPHLDRITQEIISMEFTPEMLMPEYVVKNPVQVARMANRLMYFENLINENKWYFDNLPQFAKEMIAANSNIAGIFCQHLTNVLTLQGVNVNNGNIYGKKDVEAFRKANEFLPITGQMYNDAVAEYKRKKSEAYDREAERLIARELRTVQRRLQADDAIAEQRTPHLAGIRLKSKTPSDYVKEAIFSARQLIEKNREKYLQHKELIDKVYSEYYRSLDLLSDLYGESMAINRASAPFGSQDLNEDVMPEGVELSEEEQQEQELQLSFVNKDQMARAFDRALTRQDSRMTVLRARGDALRNIISHYLTGQELSNGAQEVRKEFVPQEQATQTTQAN